MSVLKCVLVSAFLGRSAAIFASSFLRYPVPRFCHSNGPRNISFLSGLAQHNHSDNHRYQHNGAYHRIPNPLWSRGWPPAARDKEDTLQFPVFAGAGALFMPDFCGGDG